jgi:transposase
MREEIQSQGATNWLHMERLPTHAPELNPQEGVWNLLKRRELEECLLS